MVEKIDRLTSVTNQYTLQEIEETYILSDSIQFEFEKLYEDSTKLSPEFRINHSDFPYDKLRGIRNRVAHDYESVIIRILVDTINNDLPAFKNQILGLINEK